MIFAVCIAPLTVVFIKKPVFLFADIGIFKRHTAALAYHLSWRSKKCIDRNIKKLRKQF